MANFVFVEPEVTVIQDDCASVAPTRGWRENRGFGQTYGWASLLLGKLCIGEVVFCADEKGGRYQATLGGEKIGAYPTDTEARAAVDAALRKAVAQG